MNTVGNTGSGGGRIKRANQVLQPTQYRATPSSLCGTGRLSSSVRHPRGIIMAKINYRAIHSVTRWRKVGHHTSLSKALTGDDGAKALFAGRARIDYGRHGEPIGVIAWESDAETATAVRPNPANPAELQFADIPVELALECEHRRGIADAAFSSLFENDEGLLFPDEVVDPQKVLEGARTQVTVNRYERSASARRQCVAHWGCDCAVCDFSFEKAYGDRGRDFIHVHHIVSMSEIGEEYELDPVEDLRPVCPNCHAMLHRFQPTMTIDELRSTLRAGA